MEEKAEKHSRKVRTRKGLLIILLSTFVCGGCSGVTHIGSESIANPEWDNLSNRGENGVKHPPTLYLGSRFIYQDISPLDGKVSSVTMEVKERKEFEHKRGYWIEVTGEGTSYFDIYDMNLNWIGLFGDGRELETAEPCFEIFKWPLRVGKKWNSAYTLRDYSNHSHGVDPQSSKIAVNIRTYEEVRVPAGTFKAFRIRAGEETFWYAPSIGWVVKEEIESSHMKKWILQLVEYRIPKSAQNHFQNQLRQVNRRTLSNLETRGNIPRQPWKSQMERGV